MILLQYLLDAAGWAALLAVSLCVVIVLEKTLHVAVLLVLGVLIRNGVIE